MFGLTGGESMSATQVLAATVSAGLVLPSQFSANLNATLGLSGVKMRHGAHFA